GSLLKGFFYLVVSRLISRKKKSSFGLVSFQEGMYFLIQSIFNNLEEECRKKNIQLILNCNFEVTELYKSKEDIQVSFINLKENKKYSS
ncbi:hypothetical protein M3M33_14700, partial [Loigolactobacillus coryniformis]|uniref:hypothetical protein n=1 Tax=Loigolactobacillus coryniformis TaxID=1610 RepID=UPI00201A933D